MKLIFSVLDRHELWPHFHRHYLAQGVTQFICLSYGPTLPGAYTINSGIAPKDFTGEKDAELHNNIISRVIEKDEWFLIADLDEFAMFPDISLIEATQQADRDGANLIRGLFADRLTSDGSFPAHLDDDIWEQFPLCTDVTEHICEGCPKKLVAIKGPMPVSGGHHILKKDIPGTAYKIWGPNPWIHHFKWWGATPEDFFWHRFDEQGDYREELSRMLSHIHENDGGINLEGLRKLDTTQARMCKIP